MDLIKCTGCGLEMRVRSDHGEIEGRSGMWGNAHCFSCLTRFHIIFGGHYAKLRVKVIEIGQSKGHSQEKLDKMLDYLRDRNHRIYYSKNNEDSLLEVEASEENFPYPRFTEFIEARDCMVCGARNLQLNELKVRGSPCPKCKNGRFELIESCIT